MQVLFHRKAQLLVDDLLERFAGDDSLPGMSFPDDGQLTADSGALKTSPRIDAHTCMHAMRGVLIPLQGAGLFLHLGFCPESLGIFRIRLMAAKKPWCEVCHHSYPPPCAFRGEMTATALHTSHYNLKSSIYPLIIV